MAPAELFLRNALFVQRYNDSSLILMAPSKVLAPSMVEESSTLLELFCTVGIHFSICIVPIAGLQISKSIGDSLRNRRPYFFLLFPATE